MTSASSHPAAPTVFISSTVSDLHDLRSAIYYTLSSQGLVVQISEASDFDISGDRTAIEECFNNIRTCDYYILIIGNRRGCLYDDNTSITRQEYRVARDQYLVTGRPRLLFYLRRQTETAIQSGNEEIRVAGIDDAEHISSFVKEVENPPDVNTPSFLKRFHDFEELIHSVSRSLNLGRNLSETLTRHSLLYELASNLKVMVYRHGSSVFPRHFSMAKMRREISVDANELLKYRLLPKEYIFSLAMALVGRTKAEQLSTRVMEEAIDHGVFLIFNPVSNTLEESAIHKTLRQTLDDIESLSLLGISSDSWDTNIVISIAARKKGPDESIQVTNYDLLSALAYYDRVEDLYNGHLSICKVLLGVTDQLEPYERRPLSPVGDLENQRLRAEKVSEIEIVHLIRNSVSPFGHKIPPDVTGRFDEECVIYHKKIFRKFMEDNGIAEIADDMLEDVVRKSLGERTAKPEECIEDLRLE